MSSLTLYSYWRSSAAFRVRIALQLKGLEYRVEPVDLSHGEHKSDKYRLRNPQGRVPVLIDGTTCLTQSLAILEYLEERYPEPALLPVDPVARAKVRALAQIVACDIHPMNNLRVLDYLAHGLSLNEGARTSWYRHWVSDGFAALDTLLQDQYSNGPYCWGQRPSMADCCLIPQVYNAKRFACDLSPYPAITRIYQNCMQLQPFQQAAPEAQPDAPSG